VKKDGRPPASTQRFRCHGCRRTSQGDARATIDALYNDTGSGGEDRSSLNSSAAALGAAVKDAPPRPNDLNPVRGPRRRDQSGRAFAGCTAASR